MAFQKRPQELGRGDNGSLGPAQEGALYVSAQGFKTLCRFNVSDKISHDESPLRKSDTFLVLPTPFLGRGFVAARCLPSRTQAFRFYPRRLHDSMIKPP